MSAVVLNLKLVRRDSANTKITKLD